MALATGSKFGKCCGKMGKISGLNLNSSTSPTPPPTMKKNSVSEVVRGKSKARITRFNANRPRKRIETVPATGLTKGSAHEHHHDCCDDRRQEGRVEEDDFRVRHEEDAGGRLGACLAGGVAGSLACSAELDGSDMILSSWAKSTRTDRNETGLP